MTRKVSRSAGLPEVVPPWLGRISSRNREHAWLLHQQNVDPRRINESHSFFKMSHSGRLEAIHLAQDYDENPLDIAELVKRHHFQLNSLAAFLGDDLRVSELKTLAVAAKKSRVNTADLVDGIRKVQNPSEHLPDIRTALADYAGQSAMSFPDYIHLAVNEKIPRQWLREVYLHEDSLGLFRPGHIIAHHKTITENSIPISFFRSCNKRGIVLSIPPGARESYYLEVFRAFQEGVPLSEIGNLGGRYRRKDEIVSAHQIRNAVGDHVFSVFEVVSREGIPVRVVEEAGPILRKILRQKFDGKPIVFKSVTDALRKVVYLPPETRSGLSYSDFVRMTGAWLAGKGRNPEEKSRGRLLSFLAHPRIWSNQLDSLVRHCGRAAQVNDENLKSIRAFWERRQRRHS